MAAPKERQEEGGLNPTAEPGQAQVVVYFYLTSIRGVSTICFGGHRRRTTKGFSSKLRHSREGELRLPAHLQLASDWAVVFWWRLVARGYFVGSLSG